MGSEKFEVWSGPWIGYTVVERIYSDGFRSGYRYVRNWIGMHKFFFTLSGAEAYANALTEAATKDQK